MLKSSPPLTGYTVSGMMYLQRKSMAARIRIVDDEPPIPPEQFETPWCKLRLVLEEHPIGSNLEGNPMKLMERISLLVRANVGSLLGQSGDRPTDRQRSIRDGERELARAKEALAKVADYQKTLEEQIAAADEQVQAWAQKAEEALQAGDEAQAREALAQQQKQERTAQELRVRMERQMEEADRLESRLEMLGAGLEEARRQVAAKAAEQAPGPVEPEGRLAALPPAKKESPASPDLEARKARLSKKDE